MPIRINLLAEAQALEDERRRDPVKRAVALAGLILLLAGFYTGWQQFRVLLKKSDLNSLQVRWNSIDKKYQVAVESQRKALEAEERLSALQVLSTNRFLWGSLLHALQQTMTNVDEIQVVRLRVDQSYRATEPTLPQTNGTLVIPGRPAAATEKIVLTIDALDTALPPGSQVPRFKEAIGRHAFFQDWLQKTNGLLLTSLSAPQVNPLRKGQFVTFSLQCNFPEKVR